MEYFFDIQDKKWKNRNGCTEVSKEILDKINNGSADLVKVNRNKDSMDYYNSESPEIYFDKTDYKFYLKDGSIIVNTVEEGKAEYLNIVEPDEVDDLEQVKTLDMDFNYIEEYLLKAIVERCPDKQAELDAYNKRLSLLNDDCAAWAELTGLSSKLRDQYEKNL